MKTTVDLPDDLVRDLKVRAAEENRRLKDVMAEVLRRGMRRDVDTPPRQRVSFPLIEVPHPAAPRDELTPDRVAQILIEDDLDSVQR